MRRTMKTIVASLLLACATLTVGAQESVNKNKNGMKEGQSAWSIKPQMGITLATLGGDDADGVENRLMWNGGIEVEYLMNQRVGVSFGLLYTNTGCKEKDYVQHHYVGDPFPAEDLDKHSDLSIDYLNSDNMRYTFQYLSIPLMANVYVLQGLAMKIGVQPMFKMGANEVVHVWGKIKQPGNPENEYLEYDEDNKTSIRKAVNSIDFAIPLGLSYEWKNVFVDARYHFGLGSVIKATDTRNRYLSVNLGYRFQL